MSHTVDIKMIADQEIEIGEVVVNIHNIETIRVNGDGVIVDAYIKTEIPVKGWLSSKSLLSGGKTMKNIITANEELNRWCGTENINYYEGDTALGFLFKHAVPKVQGYIIKFYPQKINPIDRELTYPVSVTLNGEKENHYREDKDPAIALFWAIYEVVKDGSISS